MSLALAVCHADPTEQAHTQRSLASVRGQQGEGRRALDHAQQALALFRTLDHPVWEADSLNAVGWYAAHLGDFGTARDHCPAALAQHRRHQNRQGEADTLDSLGFIAHSAGEHQLAVDHYSQALSLFCALGNTYLVADTLDNASHPYLALGNPTGARAVWQASLQLYREQGRDEDAERVQRRLDEIEDA